MSGVALITGCGGFLGAHTVKAFRASGWQILGVDRQPRAEGLDGQHLTLSLDPHNASELRAFLEQHRPDVCVHLAAPADVPASFVDPARDFTEHVLPLLALLEGVRTCVPATRVLLVSSAAVYGDPARLPVCETDETRPISPYGFHKLAQERLVDEYRRLFAVRGGVARVFSCFGPHQRKLAVWDITTRALRGERVVLGSGAESRDYLGADDVGRALCAIATNGLFDGQPINVASGEETTIAALASKIYGLLGIAGAPQFTGRASAGSPQRWRADVSRLAGLGFTPARTLDDSLAATLEWIRTNV